MPVPAENHTTLTPDTPVRYLKGVGPKTAERFEKLGIVTLADLLCHYPRRYIDFTKPYSIAEAPTDVECVVRAEVFAKPGGRILPGGRRMERITAGDDVSSLEITWFNNPYAAQKLQLGQEYYSPSACGSCCPMQSFCPTLFRRKCWQNTVCSPRQMRCGPSTAPPPKSRPMQPGGG